jgi:RNA polymerase sigma factor (sigma-70 family)
MPIAETEIRAAYYDHKDAIYRFAWRMTGSATVAEDILQECFLSLLRNPAGYDPSRAPIRPFLLAIARNLARKRWRTEQRWDVLDEEALVVQPIDPAAGQIADLVAQAVLSLPPLQREALILFEYEELGLEEIARAVDAETGTVKARLHRARENLRRMLAPLRTANQRSSKKIWSP